MTRTEQFNEALTGKMFECPLIRLNKFKIVEATEDQLKIHVIVKSKRNEETHVGKTNIVTFHKWFEWMDREHVFDHFLNGSYTLTDENLITDFYTI